MQEKCRDPGSNRGPSDLQSDSLPTELSRQMQIANARNPSCPRFAKSHSKMKSVASLASPGLAQIRQVAFQLSYQKFLLPRNNSKYFVAISIANNCTHHQFFLLLASQDEELCMPKSSATGTRTRVARVRAEYPNQLDYSGICIYKMSPSFLSDRRSWSNQRSDQQFDRQTDRLTSFCARFG